MGRSSSRIAAVGAGALIVVAVGFTGCSAEDDFTTQVTEICNGHNDDIRAANEVIGEAKVAEDQADAYTDLAAVAQEQADEVDALEDVPEEDAEKVTAYGKALQADADAYTALAAAASDPQGSQAEYDAAVTAAQEADKTANAAGEATGADGCVLEEG